MSRKPNGTLNNHCLAMIDKHSRNTSNSVQLGFQAKLNVWMRHLEGVLLTEHESSCGSLGQASFLGT